MAKYIPLGELHRHHHRSFFSVKKRKILLKLFLFALIATAVYLAYYFRQDILDVMRQHPLLWAVFSYSSYHIGHKTLMGLFLSSAISSLFFVTIPTELVFLLYLTTSHNVALVVITTIAGNTIGFIINYLIGFVVGKQLLSFFMKKSFARLHSWTARFGGIIILVGNILPLPMPILSLVVGALRYNIKKFVLYCIIGQLVKYVLLVVSKDYVASTVIPYLSRIF